jgi:hypothetical protein
MKPLAQELAEFAADQLRAIQGWHGRSYVKRCLSLWEIEYGAGVANQVRAMVNAKRKETSGDS